MTLKMINAGLLFNTQKEPALKMARELIQWGSDNGVNFMLPSYEAKALGVAETVDEVWREKAAFATILGGDGTFLRAARYTFGYDIPLYGINLGRLGFLATGAPQTAHSDILDIASGNYAKVKRSLLKCVVTRGDKELNSLWSLNDFVISKGNVARVVELDISIGKRLLSAFLGDGIIAASPTGSTAYALSAGGPLVPPDVPCMLIVPICAHTFYTRPLVMGAGDRVSITSRGGARSVIMTQDGQLSYELLPDDRAEVSLDLEKFVTTIELPGRGYFDLLHDKLCWGFGGKIAEEE